MYTIGKLAKEFNISRSTLLYYDNIGLLKPSARNSSRYRKYSEKDKQKLEQILTYRQMSLPLSEIKKLLKLPLNKSISILENHLMKLSSEISNLQNQQHSIVNLLKNENKKLTKEVLDKEMWISILRSTGLDDEGMDRWHAEFEKSSPEAHYNFLVSLGLSAKEIKLIRKHSQKYSN